MSIDELWECVDCLRFNRSKVKGTGPCLETCENSVEHVEHNNVVTRVDLLNFLNRAAEPGSGYPLEIYLHRICVEAENQRVYVNCSDILYQYTTFKRMYGYKGRWNYAFFKNDKEYVGIWHSKKYPDMLEEFSGGNKGVWTEFSTPLLRSDKAKKIGNLSRAIKFLEIREMYLWIERIFDSHKDLCYYCINTYHKYVGNVLNSIIII